MLQPDEKRPQRFYRGYDVFDPVKVGFETETPQARRKGFLLDTTQRGNGNAGHEYGTKLPADFKRALVEFLKTQ